MPPSGLVLTTTRNWASTRLPRTTTIRVSGNPAIHFFVNKKEWDKLPKEYQAAFQAAAYEANITMMAEYDHKNPIALSKLLQSGVKLQSFSDEILEAAYKATQQLYADESAKNPAFKKIYTEWDKYRKTQNAWFSVAEMRMDRFLQTHK